MSISLSWMTAPWKLGPHLSFSLLYFQNWAYFLIHIKCSVNVYGASLVAQLVKNPPAMWETWVQSLGWEDLLEKGKATHSSILAWRIPWTFAKSWRRLSDFHFHMFIKCMTESWQKGVRKECGWPFRTRQWVPLSSTSDSWVIQTQAQTHKVKRMAAQKAGLSWATWLTTLIFMKVSLLSVGLSTTAYKMSSL